MKIRLASRACLAWHHAFVSIALFNNNYSWTKNSLCPILIPEVTMVEPQEDMPNEIETQSGKVVRIRRISPEELKVSSEKTMERFAPVFRALADSDKGILKKPSDYNTEDASGEADGGSK